MLPVIKFVYIGGGVTNNTDELQEKEYTNTSFTMAMRVIRLPNFWSGQAALQRQRVTVWAVRFVDVTPTKPIRQ